MSTPQVQAAPTPIKIKLSEVLADFQAGLSRRDIAKKYGLNQASAKKLFQHEALKNRKISKPTAFEIEEDVVVEKKVKKTKAPAVVDAISEVATDADTEVSNQVAGEGVTGTVVEDTTPDQQPGSEAAAGTQGAW